MIPKRAFRMRTHVRWLLAWYGEKYQEYQVLICQWATIGHKQESPASACSNPFETIQISWIIARFPLYQWCGHVSILSQWLWTHYKPLAWKRHFQYTTVSNETTKVRPVFTSICTIPYYSNLLFSLQPLNFFFACRRIIFQHLLRLLRGYPYLLSVPEATPATWKRHSKKDESVHYKRSQHTKFMHT